MTDKPELRPCLCGKPMGILSRYVGTTMHFQSCCSDPSCPLMNTFSTHAEAAKVWNDLALAYAGTDRVAALQRRLADAWARGDALIKTIARITGFLKPENIQAADGKIYEYYPSDEIVRSHWDGLTKALKDAMQSDKCTGIDKLRAECFTFWKACATIKKNNTPEWLEYFAEHMAAFEKAFSAPIPDDNHKVDGPRPDSPSFKP